MEASAVVELDGQYRALREGAGMVDRSPRGKLIARGAEAAEYLQGQLTNDVEALAPGEGCYAALLDRKGHVQGDARVLRLAPDEFWVDTEAIALGRVKKHLDTYRIGRDVEIADVREEHSILSVIGPAAHEVTGSGPLSPEGAHRELAAGRAVATDLGVDVIVPRVDAQRAARELREAGAVEVSEQAAEILRIESGRPRFGAEMTAATMPAEAGIAERAVSFTKGCYIGQEPVARLHYKGKPNRRLRGLRLSAPAPAGETIRSGERELGTIGSACLSPALGAIALAIVRREASVGDTVAVGDEGTTAEIVDLPF
jgi:folate-binding protein YgfZ